MRTVRVAAIAAALALTASLASAHEFPTAAKSIKSSLVQNYPPCTVPDTTTNGTGVPACLDPDPVDTVCTFVAKSQGTLTASIIKSDVKVKATLKGLSPACDGEVLTVALGVRATTDDCTGGHCTVVDGSLVGGTCTVAGGKCTISALLATGFPAGAGSEMTILSCAVRRGALDSFTCGVMVP